MTNKTVYRDNKELSEAEWRMSKLLAREPIVQEVIAKHKAMMDAMLRQGDCDDGPLFDALAKLAEWKL